MFSMGEEGDANTRPKESVDEVEAEVSTDESRDASAKDEGKVKDAGKEMAVPEEKSAVEGDSKVRILKNSLSRMFSRESGATEVAARSSTNEEGIKDETCEKLGYAANKEKSLDKKTKMTNLQKRLSFKAIKSRFSKEKKEETEATPEGSEEGMREEGELELEPSSKIPSLESINNKRKTFTWNSAPLFFVIK